MLLRDLGEADLIQRIRQQFRNADVTLGIGDDTAILEIPPGNSVLFCSDLLSENVHFVRGLHRPDSVGYKAVAVNVSDVGAMGGVPMHFVISLAAPGTLDLEWFDDFYRGVARACREFHVSLVGGDSSTASSVFVDVAMIGRVKTGGAVLRSGAKPGDGVFVTGALGASSRGLRLLQSGDRESAAVMRHLYPQPRHLLGADVASKAHAMIDISDGFSTDLHHILEESKVSARVFKQLIPAAEGASEEEVLHGGEEYELIVTAPDSPMDPKQFTRVGEIIPSDGKHEIRLVDGNAESVLIPKGWQHF